MTDTQQPLGTYLINLRELIDSGSLRDLWADEPAWYGTFTWYRDGEASDTSAELTADIDGTLQVQLMRVQPCEHDGALWHVQRNPVVVQVLQGMLEIHTGVQVGDVVATSMVFDIPAGGGFVFAPGSGEVYRTRAVDEPCYVVAVYIGADDSVPPPYIRSRPLTPAEIEDLRLAFGDLLAWNK